MNTIGVFEAKNRLAALLDEVEEGGEVLITRRGKPVARLVPAEAGFDRARARQAAPGRPLTASAPPRRARSWGARMG